MKELESFEFLKDVDLSKYTTYKVGGVCNYMVFPKNVDELKKLLSIVKEKNIKYDILGNGSNVIFSSKRYDGVIINLKYLDNYSIKDDLVICEAGCFLSKIALETARLGLKGLDFAAGIPGNIGGAVYMNAGCYGSDIASVLKEVTYLDSDLNLITIDNGECDFKYRDSIFKHNDYIIVSASFKLDKSDSEELINLINERREKRSLSQPLDKPNAGSVFRNPEKDAAGRLIEEAGLKGKRIGGASVSVKHANFIINDNNATGEDIKELIEFVQKTIKEKYNIDLVLEQELINF